MGNTFTLAEFERHILDLAVEDWTPLSDIYVEVRAAIPQGDHNRWLRQARAIATRFLEQGWVELFYDQRFSVSSHEPPVVRVQDDLVSSLIWDDTHWMPPVGKRPEIAVAIGATKAGENALYPN